MAIFIKIVLILILFYITYQDIKERQVYWFLFPAAALGCGILFYKATISELFLLSVAFNLCFISLLLLVVYLYSKVKLKTPFSQSFGLGDVLLFVGLAFTFSTLSFLVIFIGALCFALLLHLVVKQKQPTVPLAGYMSLFFGLTYLAYWAGIINGVYSF